MGSGTPHKTVSKQSLFANDRIPFKLRFSLYSLTVHSFTLPYGKYGH